MTEIQVSLTVEEAEALLPWRDGRDRTSADWNRRANFAEDAQHKIRGALRVVSSEPPEGQEELAV